MTSTKLSAPIDPRTIDVAMNYTRPWEGFHERVGPDSTGVPTIGHGFALIVKVGNKWKLNAQTRKELDAKLNRFGVDLDNADFNKLDKVIEALNAGNTALAKSLTAAHDFPSITKGDAAQLLRETITEHAEKARGWLGETAFERLTPERRAVIIDLAYNRPEQLEKIAPGLAAHINADDLEAAANALEKIGGGVRKRVTEGAFYFRVAGEPGLIQVRQGETAGTIGARFGQGADEVARRNPQVKNIDVVSAGQFLRIWDPVTVQETQEQNMNKIEDAPLGPGKWRVEEGQSLWIIARKLEEKLGRQLEVEELMELNGIDESEVRKIPVGRVLIVPTDGAAGSEAAPPAQPAPPAPGPGGSLLRELGVDVAALAPEARAILGGRLDFDTRDEARATADRGRVEAAAEEAFFRAPGFDALPRPLGRQLFAAGLQSTPGRAADLLAIALAEAGAPPRKRRKTPGGASVRPTLTPEIAQAVRRFEVVGAGGR